MEEIQEIAEVLGKVLSPKPEPEKSPDPDGPTIMRRERDGYLARSIPAEMHRRAIVHAERQATIPGATDFSEHVAHLQSELTRHLRDHLYYVRSLLPREKRISDAEVEAIIQV